MEIKRNVKLSDFSTFRIGGSASYFAEAEKENEIIEALKFAQKENLDFFILGKGSNILFSDRGFDGLVIKIDDSRLSIEENKVSCGAGLALAELVSQCYQNGLSGLAWATGIPGTVGGAICGNAAAYGSSIGETIYSADTLFIAPTTWKINEMIKEIILSKVADNNDPSHRISSSSLGDIYHLKLYQPDCQFSYRDSLFSQAGGFIILSAVLLLNIEKKETIKTDIEKVLKMRAQKIPNFPSAGSFFKNPAVPEKIQVQFEHDTGQESRNNIVPAGWLIDELGIKGKKIGGAMVSEQHANFIVNTGKATAEDVIMISSYIKQQVRDNFGVQLAEEVKLIGF